MTNEMLDIDILGPRGNKKECDMSYSFLPRHSFFLGSGSRGNQREQSPVEDSGYLSICPSLRPSVRPSRVLEAEAEAVVVVSRFQIGGWDS